MSNTGPDPDLNKLVPQNPEQSAYIASLQKEQARLEAEKLALIQEFSTSIPLEWSPEDLKEKLRELAAKAYARISMTIDDDDNKPLAFNAAKYVFQYLTGVAKITDDNDPNKEFKDLLSKLTDPSSKGVVGPADSTADSNTNTNSDSTNSDKT